MGSPQRTVRKSDIPAEPAALAEGNVGLVKNRKTRTATLKHGSSESTRTARPKSVRIVESVPSETSNASEVDVAVKKSPQGEHPNTADSKQISQKDSPRTAAIGNRENHSPPATQRDMQNPTQPRSKKREVLQIVTMCMISLSITLTAMWWLDLLSSGKWEDQLSNRVVFTGMGESIARDQLQTPTPKMPDTVVVFYSESCLFCVKMRRPFLRASNEFKELRFVAVKLTTEHEKNAGLAKNFGITHVPTLFFTRSIVNDEGKLQLRKVKYTGGAQLWDLRKFIKAQLEDGRGHVETLSADDTDEKDL